MSVTEALGPIKFAAVDVATAGDNTIVAAVSGMRIRVLSLSVVAAASVTAAFKSGSTFITGPLSLEPGVAIEASSPWGCFQTSPGEVLALDLGSSVQVSGWCTYQELK